MTGVCLGALAVLPFRTGEMKRMPKNSNSTQHSETHDACGSTSGLLDEVVIAILRVRFLSNQELNRVCLCSALRGHR